MKQKMQKKDRKKLPEGRKGIQYLGLLTAALVLIGCAIIGPERLSGYRDKNILNHIVEESVETDSEGYHYSLNSNEKLYILSNSLNSRELPGTEQSMNLKNGNREKNYTEITGNYAFVINRGSSSEEEVTDEEIFRTCNAQILELKEDGILPQSVKAVTASTHSVDRYSAIEVTEPGNNVSVWKISLSTNRQNADKRNCLLDLCLDADTGKIYEFYVRTQTSWEEINPDELVEKWRNYVGLGEWQSYRTANPLTETTDNYAKYSFEGMGDGSTIVTIGFYDGINELFLKISK